MAKKVKTEKITANFIEVGDEFVYHNNTYKCIAKHTGQYITAQAQDGVDEDMEYYYISLPISREVEIAQRERKWLVQEFDEDKDIISEELFDNREHAYQYIVSFVKFMGKLEKQEAITNKDLVELENDYNDDMSYMETSAYGHFGHFMIMTELISHSNVIEFN